MILTTTATIEGKVPIAYLGVIGAEVIFGAFFLKDWLAEGADIFGGRNHTYEKTFEDARLKAMELLEAKARARGGNAVLNIRFDYSVLGERNGMLMVAATGTVVVVTLSEEEKSKEAERERAESADHYVMIDGKRRGPFSLDQLGVLVSSGKISRDTHTVLDDESRGPIVSDLVR